MKKICFTLIILSTITNISYAAFPIENKLFEVLNQIDNTERMEETFSNDPESKPLRKILASRFGLNINQIIIGNGSDDILNLLVRTFCGKGTSAGTITPNYTLYPVLAGIQDSSFITIPYDREFSLPIESIIDSPANIFFLSSPNTPTGVTYTRKEIASIFYAFLYGLINYIYKNNFIKRVKKLFCNNNA